MLQAPGDRVGPYEILGPLGSGGMGVVYKARDGRLERDVALKFLHASGDSAENRTRLLREARAVSALNHPNICAVYDVGETDGTAYIAMEYVEGKPLGETIPAGGLDKATVIRRTIETADALAHAHGRGIVHRDLKSANILCDPDGRIKVLDFGLARRLPRDVMTEVTKSVDSIDAPGVIAGTLGWMAPEVLRGGPADARSDLWALGVLIYELSTGALPFRGGSSFELASRVLNDPPPALPASTPAALQGVAARLLQKDPAARYQSAAEVRAALQVIEGAIPRHGDASTTTTARSDRGIFQSARMRTAAWAAAIVGLAAAGMWLWWALAPPARSVLALEDQTLVSTIPRSQASPSVSPDGRLVAFVAPDDKEVPQIWIQNRGEGDPMPITSGEVPASRPRWSPKNEIVFARRGQGIWTVSSLGGTPRRIVEAGFNPNLSADGARLVYERGNRIWVANADGSAARQLDHIPVKYYTVPAAPAFSPDAQFVVYFRPEAGPNGDFWTAPVDGAQPPRRLTSDLREGGSPLWTGDGRILFSSARAGSRTLWQMSAAGGSPEPLTTGAGEDDEPELSRDRHLLLYSNVRNSWELTIGDTEGRSDRQLLERRTELLFPQFSPDGTRITFFGRHDKAVAIFTLGVDGTGLRALTGEAELNHMPRWSHDGEWVHFFQIKPEPSFRRVSAVGGASEFVLPLNWETHNFPQFDPSGRFLSYTRWKAEAAGQAIVLDLNSRVERALPGPALKYPRWSRDGRLLVGWRGENTITVCAVDGSFCRSLTEGNMPAWSGDGSRIYFLRSATAGAPGQQELWSVDADGANVRKLRILGAFRVIDTFFDVSPKDQVIWGNYRAGRRELWAATVH